MFDRENEDLILQLLFNNFQRELEPPIGYLINNKNQKKECYIYKFTDIIN